MTAANGVLRTQGQLESVVLGPNRVSFPIGAPDTGGDYSLTDFTMAAPPAPGPPPHVHEDSDECVYVLDGLVEMGIGDERIEGSAGSVMLVPRGRLHSLANVGSGTARFVVILSPSGYEGFWREMAELRARTGAPPDAETTRALQVKYHMSTSEARRF